VTEVYHNIERLERQLHPGAAAGGLTLQGLIAATTKVALEAFEGPEWTQFPRPVDRLRLLLYFVDPGQQYFSHNQEVLLSAEQLARRGRPADASVGGGSGPRLPSNLHEAYAEASRSVAHLLGPGSLRESVPEGWSHRPSRPTSPAPRGPRLSGAAHATARQYVPSSPFRRGMGQAAGAGAIASQPGSPIPRPSRARFGSELEEEGGGWDGVYRSHDVSVDQLEAMLGGGGGKSDGSLVMSVAEVESSFLVAHAPSPPMLSPSPPRARPPAPPTFTRTPTADAPTGELLDLSRAPAGATAGILSREACESRDRLDGARKAMADGLAAGEAPSAEAVGIFAASRYGAAGALDLPVSVQRAKAMGIRSPAAHPPSLNSDVTAHGPLQSGAIQLMRGVRSGMTRAPGGLEATGGDWTEAGAGGSGSPFKHSVHPHGALNPAHFTASAVTSTLSRSADLSAASGFGAPSVTWAQEEQEGGEEEGEPLGSRTHGGFGFSVESSAAGDGEAGGQASVASFSSLVRPALLASSQGVSTHSALGVTRVRVEGHKGTATPAAWHASALAPPSARRRLPPGVTQAEAVARLDRFMLGKLVAEGGLTVDHLAATFQGEGDGIAGRAHFLAMTAGARAKSAEAVRDSVTAHNALVLASLDALPGPKEGAVRAAHRSTTGSAMMIVGSGGGGFGASYMGGDLVHPAVSGAHAASLLMGVTAADLGPPTSSLWVLTPALMERARRLDMGAADAVLQRVFAIYAGYGAHTHKEGAALNPAPRLFQNGFAKLAHDAGLVGRGGHGGGFLTRGDIAVCFSAAAASMAAVGAAGKTSVAVWKQHSFNVREVNRSMLRVGLDYTAFTRALLSASTKRYCAVQGGPMAGVGPGVHASAVDGAMALRIALMVHLLPVAVHLAVLSSVEELQHAPTPRKPAYGGTSLREGGQTSSSFASGNSSFAQFKPRPLGAGSSSAEGVLEVFLAEALPADEPWMGMAVGAEAEGGVDGSMQAKVEGERSETAEAEAVQEPAPAGRRPSLPVEARVSRPPTPMVSIPAPAPVAVPVAAQTDASIAAVNTSSSSVISHGARPGLGAALLAHLSSPPKSGRSVMLGGLVLGREAASSIAGLGGLTSPHAEGSSSTAASLLYGGAVSLGIALASQVEPPPMPALETLEQAIAAERSAISQLERLPPYWKRRSNAPPSYGARTARVGATVRALSNAPEIPHQRSRAVSAASRPVQHHGRDSAGAAAQERREAIRAVLSPPSAPTPAPSPAARSSPSPSPAARQRRASIVLAYPAPSPQRQARREQPSPEQLRALDRAGVPIELLLPPSPGGKRRTRTPSPQKRAWSPSNNARRASATVVQLAADASAAMASARRMKRTETELMRGLGSPYRGSQPLRSSSGLWAYVLTPPAAASSPSPAAAASLPRQARQKEDEDNPPVWTFDEEAAGSDGEGLTRGWSSGGEEISPPPVPRLWEQVGRLSPHPTPPLAEAAGLIDRAFSYFTGYVAPASTQPWASPVPGPPLEPLLPTLPLPDSPDSPVSMPEAAAAHPKTPGLRAGRGGAHPPSTERVQREWQHRMAPDGVTPAVEGEEGGGGMAHGPGFDALFSPSPPSPNPLPQYYGDAGLGGGRNREASSGRDGEALGGSGGALSGYRIALHAGGVELLGGGLGTAAFSGVSSPRSALGSGPRGYRGTSPSSLSPPSGGVRTQLRLHRSGSVDITTDGGLPFSPGLSPGVGTAAIHLPSAITRDEGGSWREEVRGAGRDAMPTVAELVDTLVKLEEEGRPQGTPTPSRRTGAAGLPVFRFSDMRHTARTST